MEIAVVVMLVALLGAVLFLLWDSRRQTGARLDAQRAELNQALANTQQAFGQRIEGLGLRLDTMQSSLASSLSAQQDTLKTVGQQLGGLTQLAQQWLEVGKDISTLQDILKPPKLRGGFGELLLDNLLAQILPIAHFDTQYTFQNGVKVDAVIHLGPGMVPVDSKFPLESFTRMLTAASDEERTKLRRDFLREI